MFPLDYFMRAQSANALMAFRGMLPPELIMQELDRVLANDPNGWELKMGKAMLEADRAQHKP